jgi:hypothetical protein
MIYITASYDLPAGRKIVIYNHGSTTARNSFATRDSNIKNFSTMFIKTAYKIVRISWKTNSNQLQNPRESKPQTAYTSSNSLPQSTSPSKV